jgi:hypothetical protein
MWKYLLPLTLLFALQSFSQITKNKLSKGFDEKEKYFSINPFSVAEPQFTLGPSFGCRFTERSEYFFELAYVTKTPFLNWGENINKLRGARLIAQYRYHFLQQWKPLINFGTAFSKRKERQQPFIALEFRAKPFSFSSTGSFVNKAINDTLSGYSFKANGLIYGGALVFGRTLNLSADEKWKLEVTIGIGAKQRNIKFKNLPGGYVAIPKQAVEWFYQPYFHEEVGGVLVPLALRLRYTID